MATDNLQVSKRLIEEVWNKGNFDVLDELLDPSFKSEDPMLGIVDKNGFKESVKAYRSAFPDLKLEILTSVSEGNYIATRWRARGTNRGSLMGMEPTGKSAVTTGLDLAEIRNGKIVSDVTVFDSLTLLRQLSLDSSVLPAPVLKAKPEVEKRI